MYDEHVNTEYGNFIRSLKNAALLSTTTADNNVKPLFPWVTPTILEILKQKDRWFHKWKQHWNNEYYLKQFKFCRNKSVSTMRKLKKE